MQVRTTVGWTLLLPAVVGSAGCLRDSRNIHAASEIPARNPAPISATSWPLCPLLGPTTGDPGVFGTDLGFTAKWPDDDDALAVLFGDTWARPFEGCRHPIERSDDLLASLPAQRPAALRPGAPSGGEAAACETLSYARADESSPASWSGMRLFPNAIASSPDAQLDLGALRTPVATFASDERLFAVFLRSDPAYCNVAADCPRGMACSAERSSERPALGACGVAIGHGGDAPPLFCRDRSDCPPLLSCEHGEPGGRGVCLAEKPFVIPTRHGPVTPTWYREDPRRAVATTMYVATALGPERPADFAVVARFATHRFRNVAARTVAHFDPDDPDKNDYRPGTHTLLLWGRPAFFERGGAQSLPFLLYVPLDDLRGEPSEMRWQPRFFAGYGADGRPRWSEHEVDAQPIYGNEALAFAMDDGLSLHFADPEFDYVNQMSFVYVAELQRWVMLYGGDVPAFMLADPSSGETPDPFYLQPSPGAIHMRTAPHPWGRATAQRSVREAWTTPVPVLTRRAAARYLACGRGGPEELPGCVEQPDPEGAVDVIAALSRLAPDRRAAYADRCVEGELAMELQRALSGNPIGRLYGVNVIEEWTEDVTDRVSGLRPGERAVEIYWNASTWSPYQVVLFKTQLRGTPEG